MLKINSRICSFELNALPFHDNDFKKTIDTLNNIANSLAENFQLVKDLIFLARIFAQAARHMDETQLPLDFFYLIFKTLEKEIAIPPNMNLFYDACNGQLPLGNDDEIKDFSSNPVILFSKLKTIEEIKLAEYQAQRAFNS